MYAETLLELERRNVALDSRKFTAKAADVVRSRLDMLLPAESISTLKFAQDGFIYPNRNREKAKLDMTRTPYLCGIMNAMDTPGVQKVAVQGSSRVGKTTSWEVKVAKQLKYGPVMNITFFMQTKDDLVSYVDERLDWTLRNIDEIKAKIDPNDSRNSRFRYMVGGTLFQLFQASQSTLRGKAAPLMGIDEVDGMPMSVCAGIEVLIENRQRDYKGNSLAYFASHPDRGPQHGISKIISNGLRHLWYFRCLNCHEAVSFAKEADDAGNRMNWNIGTLMARIEDMDRVPFLEMIQRETRLVCPHCGSMFNDADRLRMSNGGTWLQPDQKLLSDGTVDGAPRIGRSMGFIIHAFMSPMVEIGKLALEWAAAKLTFDQTGDDRELREVEVKSLGMVYGGGEVLEQVDGPKVVQARLTAGYELRTVPHGVQFLTAFVDVQGDRFPVRVIGWDINLRSWLIDAYDIKSPSAIPGQRSAYDNIDPAGRLRDWDEIEHGVLNQTYPLQRDPTLFLGIARTCVNAAGMPGVTDKARQWNANLLARQMRRTDGPRIEPWRIRLFQGSASKKGETYGRPRQIMLDDRGKALAVPVYEVTPNVHMIKRIIARRMKIEDPDKPGRMFLPARLAPRYVKELTAEKLINDEWIAQGFNETWDGWVACELARAGVAPDRADIDWRNKPPAWATPMPRGKILEGESKAKVGYYDRLAALNAPDDEGFR
jgi:phage terminase large subunit GpA-like protein